MLRDFQAGGTSILETSTNLFALSDCIDVILEHHLLEEVQRARTRLWVEQMI